MDLTKNISIESDLPTYRDNSVICFNFEDTNHVFNMGISQNEKWKDDEDAIGLWKIKQLKQ